MLSLLHRHSWWSFFLHAWHDVVRRRGRQNNCFAIFGENFSLSLAERKFHGIFLYFLLKMHRSIEIDIHWIRRNSFVFQFFLYALLEIISSEFFAIVSKLKNLQRINEENLCNAVIDYPRLLSRAFFSFYKLPEREIVTLDIICVCVKTFLKSRD